MYAKNIRVSVYCTEKGFMPINGYVCLFSFKMIPIHPPYSHPSGPCVSMKKMLKLHKKKIHKTCKQKKDQVAISSGGPQPEPKFMSLCISFWKEWDIEASAMQFAE